MATFHRLVRFVSKSGGEPLIGEPVERDQDVGLATYAGEAVEVEVFAGRSVLQPGERTGKKEQVERLLSPHDPVHRSERESTAGFPPSAAF